PGARRASAPARLAAEWGLNGCGGLMGTRSHPVYTGCRGNYITRGRAKRLLEDVRLVALSRRLAPLETETSGRLLGRRVDFEPIVDADASDQDLAFGLLVGPTLATEGDDRRPTHQQHDDAEWQCRRDRRGLERLEAAREEQGDRNERRDDREEHPDLVARLDLATRREHAHDE